MRKRTIDMLKEYVEQNGLIKAATIFGHKDTARISRWIREDLVPQTVEGSVRYILEKELD